MRVALGEGYLACGEAEKAMECYLVAESLGEEEGLSSRRLGKLYAEQGHEVEAAYFNRRCLMKEALRDLRQRQLRARGGSVPVLQEDG